MSRTMWILLTLISVMIIVSIYRHYNNMPLPDHQTAKIYVRTNVLRQDVRLVKSFIKNQK